MARLLIRGLCRLTTGLLAILFVYGITFAMEGMTTRIPTSAIREVALTTFMVCINSVGFQFRRR